MPYVATSIRIKYGLATDPSPSQIKAWVSETERNISSGIEPEEAGRKAALRIFLGVGTHFYKSQADTLVALLQAAKNK